jgi:hypothetical protein
MVKEQLGFMVTLTVPPVLPEEGEGEQDPPIVQVKEGAPVSWTVMLIGTVTGSGSVAFAGAGRTTRGIRIVQATMMASFKGVGSIRLPL